jgi:hypothetical protein
MLGRPAVQIELDKETQQALDELVRRRSTGQQLVLRARIILLAADGKTSTQIANELAITREMVGLWRGRWASFAACQITAGTECQRTAGRCATLGQTPDHHAGTGLSDHRIGVRDAITIRASHQSLERSRNRR